MDAPPKKIFTWKTNKKLNKNFRTLISGIQMQLYLLTETLQMLQIFVDNHSGNEIIIRMMLSLNKIFLSLYPEDTILLNY